MEQTEQLTEALGRLGHNPDFQEVVRWLIATRDATRGRAEQVRGEERIEAIGGSMSLNFVLQSFSGLASAGINAAPTPSAESLG